MVAGRAPAVPPVLIEVTQLDQVPQRRRAVDEHTSSAPSRSSERAFAPMRCDALEFAAVHGRLRWTCSSSVSGNRKNPLHGKPVALEGDSVRGRYAVRNRRRTLERGDHRTPVARRARRPLSQRSVQGRYPDRPCAGSVGDSIARRARWRRPKKFDAIIALGCLIRGETAHYEAIYTEVARGIGQSQQETGVPHAFGVLTCETLEQALDRAGVKAGNKGFEAAIAAIEMASIQRRLAGAVSGVPEAEAMAGTSRWAHAASPANSPCRCSFRATWASRRRTKCGSCSGPRVTTWTRRHAALPRTCTGSPRRAAAEIDALIETHAQNWRLERMAVVDRNLLRAAVAEMLGYPNTPAAIIINESLEIARRYAAPESVQFLNGVLDAIARTRPEAAAGVNTGLRRSYTARDLASSRVAVR